MSDAPSARVVARAATTAAAILALALGCGRLVATCVDHVVPLHSKFPLATLRRASNMIEASAATPGDAAFIGTSSVWTGFDPRVFDAALATRGHPMTTLNLGVYPARPTLRRTLADRLCEAHRDSGTRWKLLLYEVATEDWISEIVAMEATATGLIAFDRVVRAMTLDAGSLLSAAMRNPDEAASLLAGRVFGYRAPYAVAAALKSYLYRDLIPSWWREPPPAEELAMRERLAALFRFTDLYGGGDARDWNREARGFAPILRQETLSAYQELLRVNSTEAAVAQQQQDAVAEGFVAINVAPSAVDRSIELIRELGRCPDRVILVVYPISPVLLATIQPDARQRLADTIAKIQKATGFPLVNLLEVPGLERADFQDGLHVTITTGSQIVSQALGVRVAEILGRQP